MLADHCGEFEAVQLGHADVDQNDGDFVFEQEFERLPSRSSDDEILSKFF